MRKLQKHSLLTARALAFFAGSFIALGLVAVPVSAQADVLQSTFGKGYGFLNNEVTIQTVQTGTDIKLDERGTFEPTFGEGYAFLEKESLAPTILTKGTVIDPKAKIFSASPMKPSRSSAFHSLFGEGYGAVIQAQ